MLKCSSDSSSDDDAYNAVSRLKKSLQAASSRNKKCKSNNTINSDDEDESKNYSSEDDLTDLSQNYLMHNSSQESITDEPVTKKAKTAEEVFQEIQEKAVEEVSNEVQDQDAVISIDDLVADNEVNNEDSILDITQNSENSDSYILIGSPPSAKKKQDDNYTVNVLVHWRSQSHERFELKMHESFQKVFKYFSQHENVPENRIMILKQEKKIDPFDTPASIDWSVIDILEGGIISANIGKGKTDNDENDSNVCKIKVQTSARKTITVKLRRDQQFTILKYRCAEELGIPEANIKFYFDGEMIDLSDTPEVLDIEDEACFDLKEKP